jgi:DNA-binding transcriptional ArsR family regulator
MAQDRLRARAQVLKAMGHPSRLAMLEALASSEKCVGELQAVVGSDLSTVSRHLAVLKSAGILEDRKQGANVFYSLRVPCVLNFFACVDAVLGARAPDPDIVCDCQHTEEIRVCQKSELSQRSASRA